MTFVFAHWHTTPENVCDPETNHPSSVPHGMLLADDEQAQSMPTRYAKHSPNFHVRLFVVEAVS